MSTIKRGDTVPWTLIANADLTTAAAVRLLGSRDGRTVIDVDIPQGDDMTVVSTDPPETNVTYRPTADDVSTVGILHLELQVTWPDQSVQTFPRLGHVGVTVNADIPARPA